MNHSLLDVCCISPHPTCQYQCRPVQVSKYSQLEDSQLSQQLSSAIAVDPNTEDHDTAVSKLSGGCAGAFGALTAAVERCMTLSGGTELKGLLGVIDSQTQQYLTRLQAAVSILQDR